MWNPVYNVSMVVPVLITSCQVSENLKIGPVMAHIIITSKAIINAAGLPVAFVTTFENLLKNFDKPLLFFELISFF